MLKKENRDTLIPTSIDKKDKSVEYKEDIFPHMREGGDYYSLRKSR